MIFRRKSSTRAGDRPAEQPRPADRSTAFITGDLTSDRRSLQLLLDTLAEVASTTRYEDLLVRLVDKSVEVTQSERGILLLGEEGRPVRIAVARGAGGTDLPKGLAYSTSVTQRVLRTGEPLASVVHSSSQALDLGQSAYDLKLRAVMCVPLAVQGRVIGAVYVDSQAQRKEFHAQDLAFFAALGQQLAILAENARLHNAALEAARFGHEMEIARGIQRQLMTAIGDLPPGLDAAQWFEPCEVASGDAFDVMPDGRGGLHVMIGDATGHGIGPALIAHSVQAAMRSYLEVLDDDAEVLRRMNERLVSHMDPGTFMSLFLARLLPAGEGRFRLRFVNAGHGCAYLCTSSGVRVLESTGPATGMMGGVGWELGHEELLGHGDTLLLTSDGVVEARNAARDMLGEGALFEVLEATHGQGAEATIAAIRARLAEHAAGAPLEDDVMALALCVTGGNGA
ncbi:MAG: GAF domain-containing SpoIIE family protein phosphatase [Planctomycetota bacterium]